MGSYRGREKRMPQKQSFMQKEVLILSSSVRRGGLIKPMAETFACFSLELPNGISELPNSVFGVTNGVAKSHFGVTKRQFRSYQTAISELPNGIFGVTNGVAKSHFGVTSNADLSCRWNCQASHSKELTYIFLL